MFVCCLRRDERYVSVKNDLPETRLAPESAFVSTFAGKLHVGLKSLPFRKFPPSQHLFQWESGKKLETMTVLDKVLLCIDFRKCHWRIDSVEQETVTGKNLTNGLFFSALKGILRHHSGANKTKERCQLFVPFPLAYCTLFSVRGWQGICSGVGQLSHACWSGHSKPTYQHWLKPNCARCHQDLCDLEPDWTIHLWPLYSYRHHVDYVLSPIWQNYCFWSQVKSHRELLFQELPLWCASGHETQNISATLIGVFFSEVWF